MKKKGSVLTIDRRSDAVLFAHCVRLCAFESRAGQVVGRGERLQKYRWSSYPSYLRSREKRESWLRCDRLFGEHGLTKESRRSRLQFARRMKQRCVEPNDPNAEQIRRGWSFGAQNFIARLLDRIPGSVNEHHQARERSETDEQKAEALISARL